MRNHRRDIHNIMSDSTSPPPKKSKLQEHIVNDAPMDLAEDEDTLEDLSSSIEEMEIDEKESDDRSKYWDEKIQKKEQKIQTDDLIYENKKKSIAVKNNIKEERKHKQLKREKKYRTEQKKTKNQSSQMILMTKSRTNR